MQSDRRVEVGLGRAEPHRDRQALDHFGRVGAEHVAAEHALARAVDHELDQDRSSRPLSVCLSGVNCER